MHVIRYGLCACVLVLGFGGVSAAAEFAQSRQTVITGEGLSELVAADTASGEQAFSPQSGVADPSAGKLGPVPGAQWTFDDALSMPYTVALSSASQNAWVGQSVNNTRLQRFAIGGAGVPVNIPFASGYSLYTAAAANADLAVLVGMTNANQLSLTGYNSAGTSPLWSFAFPANYTYVDEWHTRVSRNGAVVCCAVRQQTPSEATRLYFLNGATGTEINHWDYAARIEGLDVTDDGGLCLVTQGTNGRLISTATATEIFTGVTNAMGAVGRISGDGSCFVLGGFKVRAYRKSGSTYTIGLDSTPSPTEVVKVGISRDGTTVATVSTDLSFLAFRVRIFNSTGGSALAQYSVTGTGSYQDSPKMAVLSDNGSIVAAASYGSQNNSHPETMVFDRLGNIVGSVDTPGSAMWIDMTGDARYLLIGSLPKHANQLNQGGRVTLYQVRQLANVLYVDAGAPAGGNGASWSTAYNSLQTALDAAGTGDQIWVAAGIYRPSRRTDAANARSVTFALKNGVTVFGGFAGTESALNERNCAVNETVLSGDLNGDDYGHFGNNTENAYHVVTGSGTNGTAILDGFTITGGNADGSSSTAYRGGGMNNLAGSPTVRNCRFIANRSYYEGGGMCNTTASHASVVNCVFLANLAYLHDGGAMYNSSSNPTIVNCTFAGNSSRAVYNSGATPLIRNCILWENSGSTLADQIYPTGTGSVSYSCIQGWANPGVNGNINGNPLFFHAPLEPYDLQCDVRLRPGSPCLDAGNNTYLPADASDLDGDGDASEPLPFDLAGALRAADSPCAVDTGVGPGPVVDMGALERVPSPGTAAPRLYVDQNATGANTGQSWADAFTELRSALALAYDNNCIVDEIWVAAGTYTPTGGVDRTATFPVASGVAVYGGFSGGETALGQRNPDSATNGCVLSGDIGVAGDLADNSYTVVDASFTDATCVFDGFTIRDGNANAPVSNLRLSSGGAIEIVTGSPTIVRCRVLSNQASRYGAGLYIDEGSSPTLTDCTVAENLLLLSSTYGLGAGAFVDNGSHPSFLRCQFINNAAPDKSGGGLCARQAQTTVTMSDCLLQSNTAWSGAGLASDISANWILTRCRFINNTASTDQPNPQIIPMGGAVRVLGGTHLVTNCEFIGNSSTGHAGALLIGLADSAHFANCLFSRNTAAVNGGVIFGEAPMSFANCTFSGNAAQSGLGGALAVSASTLNIADSILWGNTDSAGPGGGTAQIYLDPVDGPSTVSAVFSVVQDAQPGDGTVYAGAGNLDLDPEFANAAGDDLRLLPDSPCIDAGSNSAVPADAADLDGDGNTTEPIPVDLDGVTRFVDDPLVTDTGLGTPPVVDMGAYEHVPPTLLLSAVSRKAHGALDFDVPLPVDPGTAPGVECRRDGPTRVILTFSQAVQAADGLPDGTEVGLSAGTLGGVMIVGNQLTVDLSGVPDMTCLTIALSGITDLAGNPLTGENTVRIRTLLGDTNGSGSVSVADVNQTRSRSGQTADGANLRSDTNCSGSISVADVNQVRSRSGNSVTCP